MIARRYPYQVGKTVQREINANRILFADKHLSEFPLVKSIVNSLHFVLNLCEFILNKLIFHISRIWFPDIIPWKRRGMR